MRSLAVRCLVLVTLVVVPSIAAAQTSTISGTVRDASGGVLPGVTVEASSPALIEKTRSTVTGSSGTYSIVALRPGTYTVKFELPGFTTAAAGAEQSSLAALRDAGETSFYRDDETLWVKLVVATAGDQGSSPDTFGPGGFGGTSIQVSR